MKVRLDKYMFEKGLSDSREKAKNEIASGCVKVNGETVRDPSFLINDDPEVRVERPERVFVSRGGEKIHKALNYFNIDVSGLICADLGASTGGFTDCLLQNGAAKVYAVDVGYGQLDYRLRSDSRVTVMERFNARNITSELFKEKIDFFVSDLSFISFTKIFPAVKDTSPGACGVFLLKPQFESEGFDLKKGVVKSGGDRILIIKRVFDFLCPSGLNVLGFTYSPIKGPKGNIEYLVYYRIGDPCGPPSANLIYDVVTESEKL